MAPADDLPTRRAELEAGDVGLWNRIIGPEHWLHETFRRAVKDRQRDILDQFWRPSPDPTDVEHLAPLFARLGSSQLVTKLVAEHARREEVHGRAEQRLRRQIVGHYVQRVETMAGCALVALALADPSQVTLVPSREEVLVQLVEHWLLLTEGVTKRPLAGPVRDAILSATVKDLTATEPITSWAQAFARVIRQELTGSGDEDQIPLWLESIATVRSLVRGFTPTSNTM